MDIFASFATDRAKEEDGVRVFLVDGCEDPAVDPWIRVARVGNPDYQKGVMKLAASLKAQKRAQGLSDEEVEIRSKNGMTELMADTILKDFGNLSYRGEKVEQTREGRLRLLRVDDFRELVFQRASDAELYRHDQAKAVAGN